MHKTLQLYTLRLTQSTHITTTRLDNTLYTEEYFEEEDKYNKKVIFVNLSHANRVLAELTLLVLNVRPVRKAVIFR